jgi:hypothetical protein
MGNVRGQTPSQRLLSFQGSPQMIDGIRQFRNFPGAGFHLGTSAQPTFPELVGSFFDVNNGRGQLTSDHIAKEQCNQDGCGSNGQQAAVQGPLESDILRAEEVGEVPADAEISDQFSTPPDRINQLMQLTAALFISIHGSIRFLVVPNYCLIPVIYNYKKALHHALMLQWPKGVRIQQAAAVERLSQIVQNFPVLLLMSRYNIFGELLLNDILCYGKHHAQNSNGCQQKCQCNLLFQCKMHEISPFI